MGLKVRKLQTLLEALDTGDERREQAGGPHVPVPDEEGSELEPDVPVEAVPLDTDVPVEVEDENLEFVRKVPPHSITDLIKDDFKPWLRVMHHPGSPISFH